MLSLTICTLLAASALATHHAPYKGINTYTKPQNYASSGAVYPIDYNDELTIKNPQVHPDANIIFTFAQTRRDQPPQVDTREERLGKYMYRRPHSTTTITTTTTTIAPTTITTLTPPTLLPQTMTDAADTIEFSVESDSSESVEEIDLIPQSLPFLLPVPVVQSDSKPVMLPTGTTAKPFLPSFHDFKIELPESAHIDPKSRYPDIDMWQVPVKQQALLPTVTTAKPVVPNFKDFTIEIPDSSKIDPKARFPEVSRWPAREIPPPPSPPNPEWEEFEKLPPRTVPTWHQYHSKPTERVPIVVLEDLTTPKSIESQTAKFGVETQTTKHRKSHNHKHKFNEIRTNDTPAPVVALSVTPAPSMPVVAKNPALVRSPPPPPPTLTPWMGDNF